MNILRKLVINAAILLAIVFIVDLTVGRTLRYFYFRESSGQHRRITHALEETEAQLVVFGASRASRHYVPEVFAAELDMTCYNAGMEGNGIYYQLAVLRSILLRHRPEVVVLDFDGVAKGRRSPESYGYLSCLLPYYQAHQEIRDIIELRGRFERVKLCSEIYPFNSKILTIAIGNMPLNKARHVEDRGYVPLTNVWADDRQTVLQPVVEADSQKVACYNEFFTRCAQAGVRVFLVCSPTFFKIEGPGIASHFNELRLPSGVCIRDFSRDELFNDRILFNDPGHLNHHGAVIFSRLVASEMKAALKSN